MSKFDAGSTSKSTDIYITDALGNPKTGLAYNSAGAGAYYHRLGSAPVAITLATLASVTAAYSSGGFIEVDATNHPGLYRLDIPNAALASGVDEVFVSLKFTGALIQPLKIILETKTLAAITTAVLDELLSGHAVSGSVGAGISTLLTNVSAVKAITDVLVSPDIIADALLKRDLSAVTGAAMLSVRGMALWIIGRNVTSPTEIAVYDTDQTTKIFEQDITLDPNSGEILSHSQARTPN